MELHVDQPNIKPKLYFYYLDYLSVNIWLTEAAASAPTQYSNHTGNPKSEIKHSCMSSYVNRYFPFS